MSRTTSFAAFMPRERQLVELRGLSWEGSAARLGGSAESLRKQLARARDWESRELGLNEVNHE